ncbi:hypothetical protein FRC06_000582 [Ceratobasidium sp. 370]|nr:hypothetical protein FRC06_000582 [Ceratobasidium sp. 370]
MLDDAAPRGWVFHESFTTAYHEPASTRIPLHEDTFTVRTSSRPRPSASAAASARLDRNLLPPPQPSPSAAAAEPKRAVARRRAMYDPTTTDVLAEQTREASTSASAEERDVPHLPPISPPDQVGAVVQELRQKYPRARSTWEQEHRSSGKRTHAQVDGTTDRRSPPYLGHPAAYLETQGKRKMMSSQSPAFRLDNLLESSPVELSRPAARSSPAIGGYDLPSYDPPTAEPAPARAPSIPVFTGRLPPTPFTGSSSLGSATHTSIADLGISVPKDLNLGAFAVPDDFEREIFAQPSAPSLSSSSSQSSSFASSSRLPGPAPGSKPPRKLAATAPRRKSRGLFPHDDVPLVISSSTTKQSRYRPSGDRQPVACGYKDPITQVQCDEPFNRPVELRRHVRAVHVPAEALAVTMGQLSRSQATLLPNDWKPGDGDVLRPTCVCGKVFSRLDALRRHWTGVNAKVVDGKCIECPSSLAKKK